MTRQSIRSVTLFQTKVEKGKKTLGISFYPVKPWKLLPAPRVEELLCAKGCFISFSQPTVNCTWAASRQQAVLEGRLSPVGRAVWIRLSDSFIDGANRRSLRCHGRRHVEHK